MYNELGCINENNVHFHYFSCLFTHQLHFPIQEGGSCTQFHNAFGLTWVFFLPYKSINFFAYKL
jgi:hypothetical protein